MCSKIVKTSLAVDLSTTNCLLGLSGHKGTNETYQWIGNDVHELAVVALLACVRSGCHDCKSAMGVSLICLNRASIIHRACHAGVVSRMLGTHMDVTTSYRLYHTAKRWAWVGPRGWGRIRGRELANIQDEVLACSCLFAFSCDRGITVRPTTIPRFYLDQLQWVSAAS